MARFRDLDFWAALPSAAARSLNHLRDAGDGSLRPKSHTWAAIGVRADEDDAALFEDLLYPVQGPSLHSAYFRFKPLNRRR